MKILLLGALATVGCALGLPDGAGELFDAQGTYPQETGPEAGPVCQLQPCPAGAYGQCAPGDATVECCDGDALFVACARAAGILTTEGCGLACNVGECAVSLAGVVTCCGDGGPCDVPQE